MYRALVTLFALASLAPGAGPDVQNPCPVGQAAQECAVLTNNLGSAYYNAGKYHAAEIAFIRAISLWGGAAPPGDLAKACYNLASAYRMEERYQDAARFYLRALDLSESIAGPQVAIGLSNLGTLMLARHKYAAAEPLLARAEQIDRKNFAPNDPRIGYDLRNEGAAAFGREHYGEAERFYLQSQAILEKALPPGHPELGKIMARLANVYRVEGRLDESLAWFPRAIHILEQAWGAQNPQLLAVLQSYEAVLRESRNYAEAEQVEVRRMGIRVAEALRSAN